MTPATIDSLADLLRYCEQFAKHMIAEAGEFHPFGAFVNADGRVEALGAHLGTELPRGSEVYAFLENALGSMVAQGKVGAYALAANVNIPSGLASPLPDGIRVHVEAPGYSRLVYTPYRVLPLRAIRKFLAFLPTVQYLEPIAVDVPNKVFASAAG